LSRNNPILLEEVYSVHVFIFYTFCCPVSLLFAHFDVFVLLKITLLKDPHFREEFKLRFL